MEQTIQDHGAAPSPARFELEDREAASKTENLRHNVGIIKKEPVFCTTLQLLAWVDQFDVPLFVRKCVSVIESLSAVLPPRQGDPVRGLLPPLPHLQLLQAVPLQTLRLPPAGTPAPAPADAGPLT